MTVPPPRQPSGIASRRDQPQPRSQPGRYRAKLWQSQMSSSPLRARHPHPIQTGRDGIRLGDLMPVMVGRRFDRAAGDRPSTRVALGTADFGAMAAKAVYWAFFAGALGFATASLTANVNLVSKIYFAEEVAPARLDRRATLRQPDRRRGARHRVAFSGCSPGPGATLLPVLAFLLVTLAAAVPGCLS